MTQTFTAADIAAFAEIIRPAFDRIAQDGLSQTEQVKAAALIAQRDTDRDFSRRLTSRSFQGYAAGVLGGTYDEFRAEAGV